MGSLGFTVIATAGNGKEALKVIEEENPQVVIADIRMPVMDGLQLIQRLRAAGQHLHVLILSGYADFEYAKQAIKYGVAGYLLKPVNISEMSASLKLVREQIEKDSLSNEGRQTEVMDRDLYLHSLLVPQQKTEDPAKLRSKTKQADLLWGSYEVVVIHPRVSDADRSEELIRLSVGLKQGIEGRSRGMVTVISPMSFFCSTRRCTEDNGAIICTAKFGASQAIPDSLLQPEGLLPNRNILAALIQKPRKR